MPRRQGPGLPGTEAAWSRNRSNSRSSFGSGSGGVGSGVSFGGFHVFSSGLNEVTVGLIALKSAISLVETGLNVLSKSAMEVVGAIAQLGGAKGLQAMFVESVTNQQLLNQTRFAVSGVERSTSKELMDLTAKLSESIQAGGFDRAEWLGAIKSIGTITGKQSSLDENTLSFLGKMALITGGSLQGQSEVFGRIKAGHPQMTDQQVVDTMLAGHAIGQQGSFNMAELPGAHTLMGLSNRFSGDTGDIEKMLFSIGSLIKSTGGVELNTTGVQYQAFLNAAVASKSPNFKFNKADQLTNVTDSLEHIVNTPESQLAGELTASAKLRVQARNFTDTLRMGVSERAGVAADDFSPKAQAARERVIEQFTKLGMTMADFQKEYDESLTPATRFRVAFNRISDHLEGKFLGTLERMQPAVDAFADTIVNHENDIGNFFDQLAVWLGVAVEKFPDFMSAVMSLASAVGSAAEWILEFTTGAGREDIDAKVKNKEYQIAQFRKLGYSEDNADLQILEKDLRDLQALKTAYSAEQSLNPESLAKSAREKEEQQQKDRQDAKLYSYDVQGVDKPRPPTRHEEKTESWHDKMLRLATDTFSANQRTNATLSEISKKQGNSTSAPVVVAPAPVRGLPHPGGSSVNINTLPPGTFTY